MHRAIGFGSRSRLQAVVLRGFAKKGKSDAALANAVSGQLETALDFAELSESAKGVHERLKKQLGGIRGGRPDAGMFDHLSVDAYGGMNPLNSVAQVTLKTPKAATVTVFDPELAAAVAAAIEGAGMNLNPQVDGATVTVPIPKLSKEVRDDLVKVAAKHAEKAKQGLRKLRKGAMDDLKVVEDEGGWGEDDIRRDKGLVEALVAQEVEKVDGALDAKRAEILDE